MATMRRVLSGEAVGVPLLPVDSSFCKESARAESSVTDLTWMKKISISINMVQPGWKSRVLYCSIGHFTSR